MCMALGVSARVKFLNAKFRISVRIVYYKQAYAYPKSKIGEFTINENHVCTLFVRNVQCSLAKIFSLYSHDIVSTCNLKSFIRDMFFG